MPSQGNEQLLEVQYLTAKIGLGNQCKSVLRTLPQWFGREDALLAYVEEIENFDTYTAWKGQELIGFFTVNRHFETSAELHVLGVKAEFHGLGIGTKLYELVESDLTSKGIKFIQVKTLSPLAQNSDYEKTLKFYTKVGFTAIEDFTELWGEDTPCRQLVKHIAKQSR